MACVRVADGSQAGGGRASQFRVASLGRARGSRRRPLARWGEGTVEVGGVEEVAAEQHQQDGKDEDEEEEDEALAGARSSGRRTSGLPVRDDRIGHGFFARVVAAFFAASSLGFQLYCMHSCMLALRTACLRGDVGMVISPARRPRRCFF